MIKACRDAEIIFKSFFILGKDAQIPCFVVPEITVHEGVVSNKYWQECINFVKLSKKSVMYKQDQPKEETEHN